MTLLHQLHPVPNACLELIGVRVRVVAGQDARFAGARGVHEVLRSERSPEGKRPRPVRRREAVEAADSPLCHQTHLSFESEIQVQHVAHLVHIALRHKLQPHQLPDLGDRVNHSKDAAIAGATLLEDRVEDHVDVAIHEAPHHLGALLEIRSSMHILQDPQVVVEIRNETILLVPVELGGGGDGTLVLGKDFGAETVLAKHTEVLVHVAVRRKVRKVRLADDDVVGGAVVVQLLMPLLDPVTLALRQVVAMHDVQNLIADSLPVAAAAAAADTSQHEPEDLLLLGASVLPAPGNEHVKLVRGG
mmetsp:Transcript_1044/g.2284  ORF Transcript_1044/g.2284 Transcript_1044/m.2284 type:complete len:303 (-) Transcript_1044:197-1105(-)